MTKRRKTEEENADPNNSAAADGVGDVEEKRPRLEEPSSREQQEDSKLAAQVNN